MDDARDFCFNPLTGIRSFLTILVSGLTTCTSLCFNPLTGIRSFLTILVSGLTTCTSLCFNPLTGIRSFLTILYEGIIYRLHNLEFQSPHGDSFFSDR